MIYPALKRYSYRHNLHLDHVLSCPVLYVRTNLWIVDSLPCTVMVTTLLNGLLCIVMAYPQFSWLILHCHSLLSLFIVLCCFGLLCIVIVYTALSLSWFYSTLPCFICIVIIYSAFQLFTLHCHCHALSCIAMLYPALLWFTLHFHGYYKFSTFIPQCNGLFCILVVYPELLWFLICIF